MKNANIFAAPGTILLLITLILLPIIYFSVDLSSIKTANDIKQKEFDELQSLDTAFNDLDELSLDEFDIDPSLLEGLSDFDLSEGDSATEENTTENAIKGDKKAITSSTEKRNKTPYHLYIGIAWLTLFVGFLIALQGENSLFLLNLKRYWSTLESDVTILSLTLLILFTLSSLLEKSIHIELSSSEYLTHSVIFVALLGATLAFRNREHISLTISEYIIPEKKLQGVSVFTASITAIILFTFFFSSLLWPHSYDAEKKLISISYKSLTFLLSILYGLIFAHARFRKYPVWRGLAILTGLLALILIFKWPFEIDHYKSKITLSLYKFLYLFPAGLFLLAFRSSIQKLHDKSSLVPLVIGVTTPLLFKLLFPTALPPVALYGAIAILLLGTFLGVPIFTVLTGFAMLFIYNEEHGLLVRVLDESYGVLTLEEYATIPLFTISGFLLSFSKSGERLIRFFKALFGPIPGGIAIVAVLVSAFFTTFTGASGVTILALGGLLHYIMTKDGYSERFTTGYLTSSGSIGLLFPPALPIILFGVQAKVSIIKLFAGGFLPGILLVGSISLYGVYTSKKIKNKEKITFSKEELWLSFKAAIFEIILPLLIIYLFFSGKAVIVETAAFSVIYLLIVQLFIHRDISINQLPTIFIKAASVAGSVLIILVGAKALSSQIIFAQIPQHLTEWCQANIHHKWTFLLILNIALLITGFFMDIFSAIMVIVPLILPISKAFNIDPVHLGIIFLANLEVGYLTPPVGLNLFLSALTFKQSLLKIYRSVLPFLVIMIVAVFIITYVPALTSFGVKLGDMIGLYGDEKSEEELMLQSDETRSSDTLILETTL